AEDAREDVLFGPDHRGDEKPAVLTDPGSRQAAIEKALDKISQTEEAQQRQRRFVRVLSLIKILTVTLRWRRRIRSGLRR
uniref:hypothetical protein n=1 Tax=Corynebacterium cystitidis TaxID=35757 RepID=UPI00211E2134